MATFRNPFLSRFSDRTGLKNSTFLSMYAPQFVRELLENENLLLPKATRLIGIPGSGKSSILRLFSVDILTEIIRQKTTYLHIYDVLSEAKVIDGDIIKSIGLYVPIDEFFYETDNVKLDQVDNKKLFYTLFDLRVARQLNYSLERLRSFYGKAGSGTPVRGVPSDRMPPRIFSETKTIDAMEREIQDKEMLVSQVLNSFPGTPIPERLELHHRFFSLDLIDAQIANGNINFILMVDDAHELYPEQLKALIGAIEKRYSFPRWITTRKHIYSIDMLLGNPNGTTDGREVITIDVDRELRQSSLYKKFIKILVDRRLKLTSALHEFNADYIEGMLPAESSVTEEKIYSGCEQQRQEAFQIRKQLMFTLEELDKFVAGKTLDPIDGELVLIKAHRASKKKQQSFFQTLDLDNIASKDKQAAELFWKKRVGLALYSGFDSILAASNYNVEQFMRIFSPFIDRLIYRVELNKIQTISPQEQANIFDKVVKEYIENIILRLHYGNKIYQLVDNLGRFFSFRTYEPNAPHAPGITQFAMLASDIEEPTMLPSKSELSNILTTAIAHNVFVPEGTQHQGTKGSELKYIFSLNRLLCIKYELPMQKGDFQLLPLDLVEEMCIHPFKPEDIKKRKGRQSDLWEYSDEVG